MMKKLLLVLPVLGFALAANAQNYYTRQAGNWADNNSVWSTAGATGAACACTPGNTVSGTTVVTIGNTVTSTDALSSLSGSAIVTLNAGDSATIRVSSFDMSNSAMLNVNGTLVIYGNVTMAGTTAINVGATGHVVIFGNVTNSGSATVANNGYFLVRGTVSKSGSAAFNGTKQSFETRALTGVMDPIQ